MASSLTRRGAAVTMAALAAGASDYVSKPSASSGDAQRAFRDQLGAKIAIWAAHARRGRAGESDLISAVAFQATSPLDSPARSTPCAPGTSTASPPVSLRRLSRAADAGPGLLRPLKALAVGSSTGGPQALLQLFGGLAEPPSCPVFVTQHMPPAFTAMLAEQIGR